MVGGQVVGCGLSIPFVGSFLLFFSSSNSATVLRSCSTDLAVKLATSFTQKHNDFKKLLDAAAAKLPPK